MPVLTPALRTQWSSTLKLPKSAFPPRAVLADRAKYLKRCTDDLYVWQQSRRSASGEKDQFVLHDGPPYANGSLHVGHALNKILKDFICRVQLSQGKLVDYVPGWDCHGLPIEKKALEQHMGAEAWKQDRQLGAHDVRNAAKKLATQTIEEQKKDFRRWGIMADWHNAWSTMDKTFELSQLGVFAELVKKGLIYRKLKPVYWSPSSHTALAEAELEYKEDHVSTAVFVKFPLDHIPRALDYLLNNTFQSVNLVVWTTSPWTLPANRAIAINAENDYALVRSESHGHLLIAVSRLAEVHKVCGMNFDPQILGVIRGSDLAGATYRFANFDKTVDAARVLHADFVSTDSGTGIVHLAPGHGMEDYEICSANGIDAVFAPVDDDGRFTEFAFPNHPSILAGKEVLSEGSTAVLDYLGSRGLVLGHHKFKHKYYYDWRSKQPAIVRATEQWFADVGEVQEPALRSLENVRFIPDGGKDRLSSFVKNRREWCISRQRSWGVPIPALFHRVTGYAVLTTDSISHIMSVISLRGIDAWWTDDESDPAWVPENLKDAAGLGPYRRGKDTMDVWFDSGTSWTELRKGDAFRTAEVYIEGTDQHRGWFQSSLLTRIAYQSARAGSDLTVSAPFKTLVTHGFTLDQEGRKMSKSIGNITSPLEIMNGTLLPPIKRKKSKLESSQDTAPIYDGMGPDALRLWVASSDYTKDVVVGQLVLKSINTSLSKYRVTFKLLLGLLEDYDPAMQWAYRGLTAIDQIALMQLKDLRSTVRHCYREYEFYKAISAINKYMNSDLSAFYIESIKDRVYADAAKSVSRTQAQMTLWEIFQHLLSMLAPITPLLVEEVWNFVPEHQKSLRSHPLKNSWSELDTELKVRERNWETKQLKADLPHLLAANAAVKSAQEKARVDGKMGSSLQSFVTLAVESKADDPTNAALKLFEHYQSELESLFVVSRVDVCLPSQRLNLPEVDWSYSSEFEVSGQRVEAQVYTPREEKCVRCWRYAAQKETLLGEALCQRCTDVLQNGQAELSAVK
ncbi:isoleucine-tRNA ligase [Loxospora ochrophaea]|nr:isoleucine-tRNA ligase [Loxospora ochrophaea]